MRWLQRNVFLFDGLGALASAVATLIIVLAFQPRVGMPAETLWGLVLLAAVFVAYSLGCWARRAPLRPWLPILMGANLAYCAVVATALATHASEVSTLGMAYFIAELLIIVGVVTLERRVLRAVGAPMGASSESTPIGPSGAPKPPSP